MKEKIHTTNQFFASANGFCGFRSYFGEIFSSNEHIAVYILKGGPGTGKSTLLKRLCEYCWRSGIDHEAFRCSSDPESLDGVIIKGAKASVAVLDGTAPHVRDAEIPGAVDELLNLGDAWDIDRLRSMRKDVLELNSKKSVFYASAYKYLQKSYVFDTNIKAEISKYFDFDKCEEACISISNRFCNAVSGKQRVRLISSFSKFGYATLDDFFDGVSSSFYIAGKLESERLFMNALKDRIKRTKASACFMPSPLDGDSYECILIDSANTLISVMQHGSLLYDSSKLFKVDNLSAVEEEISPMMHAREYYLKLAADELQKASECHFALEKLYTPCMDFEKLDIIYGNLLEKIKNILQTEV